jgi:hypothetical protein
MSEIIILSREELRELYREVITEAVAAVRSECDKPAEGEDDLRLMSVSEICTCLGIGRTAFEDRYKSELIASGMFQLNGKNSSFRMLRSDFKKYISNKQL